MVRKTSSRQLVLSPARPLRPGRYSFVATHEGMFGGRDFAYLRVVPATSAVTSISSRPHAAAPAVLDALLPLCAGLVALAFAALLLRSLRRRRSGEKVLWALGFLLFAVAAACEAAAQRAGWSPALFRVYYLAGGVLTVAYLGAGSAWLLLPKRGRDVLVGGLAVATAAAAVTVALAGVDAAALAATAVGRPPANSALGRPRLPLGGRAELLRHALPVGGSLYSILRRRRVRANLWIGGGALVVALATGLSRADSYSLVYAGQLHRDRADVQRLRLRREGAVASAGGLIDPVPGQVQPEGQARVAAPSKQRPALLELVGGGPVPAELSLMRVSFLAKEWGLDLLSGLGESGDPSPLGRESQAVVTGPKPPGFPSVPGAL